MAKYKVWQVYPDGEKEYLGIKEPSNGEDIRDYIEFMYKMEAYNFEWKKVTTSSRKKKPTRKTVTRRKPAVRRGRMKKTVSRPSRKVKVKILVQGNVFVGGTANGKLKRISKAQAQRNFDNLKVIKKYYSKAHMAKVYHLG